MPWGLSRCQLTQRQRQGEGSRASVTAGRRETWLKTAEGQTQVAASQNVSLADDAF